MPIVLQKSAFQLAEKLIFEISLNLRIFNFDVMIFEQVKKLSQGHAIERPVTLVWYQRSLSS